MASSKLRSDPPALRRGNAPALELALGLAGLGALAAAFASRPSAAAAAAGQNWSPFVLVAGLLLIGAVAADDGLFAAAGRQLGRVARHPDVLFAGAALVIGAVTAVLNLDTSVAFLTPVLVHSARSRGEEDSSLLYGALLLSNAGSLFLPGSNLTNLIVAGHQGLTGGRFLARMWLPALSALVATAVVVAVAGRTGRRRRPAALATPATGPDRFVIGPGLVAVVAAAVLVIVLRSPALPVAAVGAAAAAVRLAGRRLGFRPVLQVLGLPVLVGLFGMAVGLGTLGRIWSGPASLLAHLDAWATAGVAAGGSVLLNNLPAASLLAARPSPHPLALLVGLNLGPNLFVTGSLAWLLWLRAAASAGARPSIGRATRLGVVAVPLSMGAALGVLALTGAR